MKVSGNGRELLVGNDIVDDQEIIIDEEFRLLLPELDAETFKLLEENMSEIKKRGNLRSTAEHICKVKMNPGLKEFYSGIAEWNT